MGEQGQKNWPLNARNKRKKKKEQEEKEEQNKKKLEAQRKEKEELRQKEKAIRDKLGDEKPGKIGFGNTTGNCGYRYRKSWTGSNSLAAQSCAFEEFAYT